MFDGRALLTFCRNWRGNHFALIGLVIFGLSAHCVTAQTIDLGDDVARPIPGVGHDYIRGLSATVNPANGNLFIKINLPVPPSRGLNLPFAITYNSGEVHRFTSERAGCGGMDGDGECTVPGGETRTLNGWSDTFPYATYSTFQVHLPSHNNDVFCTMSTSFNFYAPDGSTHMLGLASISNASDPNYNGACASATYNTTNCLPGIEFSGCYGGDLYVASASGGDERVHAVSDLCNGGISMPADCNSGRLAFTVTDTSGTTYYFGNTAVGLFPSKIEDRNGNTLQVSGAWDGSQPISIKDTAERNLVTIDQTIGSTPEGSTPEATSYEVGTLTFTPAYMTTTANYTPRSTQVSNVPPNSLLHCVAYFQVNDSSLTVLHTLTLPNHQQYLFKYDPQWGLVNEIDYPDGGWVRYTWKLSDTESELASFSASQSSGTQYPPVAGMCNYRYQTPVVATRTVGFKPGVTALVQTFTYNTTWNQEGSTANWGVLAWSSKTTQVQTTDETTGETTTTTYTYTPVWQPAQPDSIGQIPAELPVESTVQYRDWNGSSIKTEDKQWNNQFDMSQEKDTYGTQTDETNYLYSYSTEGFTRLAEKDEYDFGNSTPTRKTLYSYYRLNEPNQIITEDGAGNRIAETDVYYDGQTAVGAASTAVPVAQSVSGLPSGTHDEANYGTSSTLPRGNPTTVIRWSNLGPSSKTTYTYDETGQELSMTAPCGNSQCADLTGTTQTTTYSYTDPQSGGNTAGNSNAYVTAITNPLGQTESFTYDYATGNLLSSKDVNHQTTHYYYYGPTELDRLKSIVYPDGGSTGIQYNDSVPSITTTRQLGDSEPSEVSVQLLDGMGRVVQTQLTSAPQGTVYVDKTYNGVGSLKSVSNPYRLTSDATYGITSYLYDALGRKTYECEQDNNTTSSTACTPQNSYQHWAYSGNVVTYTDEDGNQWQRTYDSLGHLTQVVEPDGASKTPTMKTSYSYDALGNLLEVDQWGGSSGSTGDRKRTFSYNSLSELTNTCNPEAISSGSSCTSSGPWSGSYTYDADGNVLTKTDARGVTTKYAYDALNRLLSKSYANDPSGTPWSCYEYDTSSIAGAGGNLIGRLTNAWTQKAGMSCSTAPSSSSYVTLESDLSYDPIGRLLTQQQCTPANCTTSAPYKMNYTYDLAGNLHTSTDGLANTPGAPAQPLQFTYNWNGAQWLQSVDSNWMDASHPSPLMSVQSFIPTGAVSAMTYGGGLTLNRTYDNRLRITGETDNGGVTTNPTPGTATITITGAEQSQ